MTMRKTFTGPGVCRKTELRDRISRPARGGTRNPIPQLTANTIKLIAIILMTLNHFSYIFLAQGTVMSCLLEGIGYFTAITMCVLMTESFAYTRSVRNYAMRLGLFAVLSQLPFRMMTVCGSDARTSKMKPSFFSDPSSFISGVVFTEWNIMFTLLVCLAFLCVLEYVHEPVKRTALAWLCFFASFIGEWGGFLILFVWGFYQIRRYGNFSLNPFHTPSFAPQSLSQNENSTKEAFTCRYRGAAMRMYGFSAAVFSVYLFLEKLCSGLSPAAACLYGCFGMGGLLLSMLVMCYLYSGKDVRTVSKTKRTFIRWFFYVYYPVHIALLVCIKIHL